MLPLSLLKLGRPGILRAATARFDGARVRENPAAPGKLH